MARVLDCGGSDVLSWQGREGGRETSVVMPAGYFSSWTMVWAFGISEALLYAQYSPPFLASWVLGLLG